LKPRARPGHLPDSFTIMLQEPAAAPPPPDFSCRQSEFRTNQ